MSHGDRPAFPCRTYREIKRPAIVCPITGKIERIAEIDVVPDQEHPGLTKREWFAAMAMQGMLACPAPIKDADDSYLDRAICAYRQADAMIAAEQEKK